MLELLPGGQLQGVGADDRCASCQFQRRDVSVEDDATEVAAGEDVDQSGELACACTRPAGTQAGRQRRISRRESAGRLPDQDRRTPRTWRPAGGVRRAGRPMRRPLPTCRLRPASSTRSTRRSAHLGEHLQRVRPDAYGVVLRSQRHASAAGRTGRAHHGVHGRARRGFFICFLRHRAPRW